jgi:hypothetical protein
MNDLLARAIAAYGGLDRWNKFKKVTATYVGLWPMKGLEVFPHPIEVTPHWLQLQDSGPIIPTCSH